MRFGRRIPAVVAPHLKFATYLYQAALPTPPAEFDQSDKAIRGLRNSHLNNTLGCCVIAAKAHIEEVWTGNANGGNPKIASDQDIITEYSAIGGYVPDRPETDQGCDMQTACNWYVANSGFTGVPLAGWLGVNAANATQAQTACYLFGDVYLGMALPDSWITPFPSGDGFEWGVEGPPNPSNGHCVMASGYTKEGLIIWSWGMRGLLTWDALAKYAVNGSGGECYTLFSTDQLVQGQVAAPNGISWTQLVTDWDAIGGHIAVPPPAPPAPSPSPLPSGSTVSLAQAQGWVTQAFTGGRWLYDRGQAAAVANAALAAGWPK